MVHISDGVLPPETILTGWVATITLIFLTLRNMKAEDVPKLSVMTAAFFVASLIHFPVGPTSVHLIFNGLTGVVLGVFSYPAIFIGLLLQATLFGHGGITALGVNTFDMGTPALLVGAAFGRWLKNSSPTKKPVLGAMLGGFAVMLAVILTAFMLRTAGKEFNAVIAVLVVSHIPVIIVEAVVTGVVVRFLLKVKPEVLGVNVNGEVAK
ncbi:MAG: cobalt transporter CbiM [Methanobacteriota archaeon]|nr:MAG: cobalt transporter CbiM [Euryarchaeota archaeon]